MFKICAAGFLAALVCILVKSTNAEISLVLSACCVTVIMICVLKYSENIVEFTRLINNMIGSGEEYISPIMKCLGIAVVTRFASQLCKDASQNAISASVDFAGTVCALFVSMPLLMSVLKMLSGLI